MNADLYYEKSIIDRILYDNRDVVVLADRSRVEHNMGDYFLQVNDGVVVKYGKELLPEDRSVESFGVSKISAKKVPKLVSELDRTILNEQCNLYWANILYSKLQPVYVIDVSDCYWAEVDYPEDYSRLQEYVETSDFTLKYVGC